MSQPDIQKAITDNILSKFEPRVMCKVCRMPIVQRTSMETKYWIHFKDWWLDKDHQAEPTWVEFNPATSEYAWW